MHALYLSDNIYLELSLQPVLLLKRNNSYVLECRTGTLHVDLAPLWIKFLLNLYQ